MSNNKHNLEEENHFDDCAVCQAIKRAQEQGRVPDPDEMRQAFQKAKEQGAIVGGEWFEE